MNLEYFGDRVHYARKHLNNYSLSQVGNAIKINRATIGNWEKSKDLVGKAEAGNLWSFCQYCRVDFQWMLTGTGNPELKEKKQSEDQESFPLIHWNDIGKYSAGIPLEYEEYVKAAPYIASTARSAATELDKEMLVEFNRGDLILFDPDLAPENGQYLIYNLDNEITIVSYIELTGGRKHISALTNNASLENYIPTNKLAVIKGKLYN